MKAIIAVPAIAALLYRAHSKKSLTPSGLVAAALTAIVHALHPWNLPFALLGVFFMAGTRATHVKEHVKAHLTLPASGQSGGEGPRTHVQVFANSLVASVLSLLHTYQLHQRRQAFLALYSGAASSDIAAGDLGTLCFSWGGDLLVVGIIANYAVVAADTFSSELGILSRETPRLITSLTLRRVPRGTNGGVTLGGLAAGLLGSMIVVTAAVLFLPLCQGGAGDAATDGATEAASAAWTTAERRQLMVFLTLWGVLGSLVDSVLGGLFQRTVRDVRSGKVVEGTGGQRVIISEQPGQHLHGGGHPKDDDDATQKPAPASPAADRYDARNKHRRPSFGDSRPSRVVENGWDLLDNNDVNLLMAASMSLGAMAVAGWYWGVPWQSVFRP